MVTYYHSTARSRKLSVLSQPKAGSWCHVVEPTPSELDEVAEKFKLDRDILTDATDVYEAPRVEVNEGVTYVFARYCHPEGRDISTEPLLIVYTNNNIITVMRSADDALDLLISGKVPILTTQKTKTFLHILEQINRSYRVQLNIVSKQILQYRSELRQSAVSAESIVKFIELEEDLNEYLTALQPQALVLTALESGRYMKLYEDDRDLVEDIMLNTSELIELSKTRVRTVTNIRQAYSVIATNNLNKIFKRLTSIAIFISIPTVVGALFGMNVALPFQDHPQAFIIIILIISGLMFVTFRYFDRKNWY
jgi:magnesium transporter